MDPTRRKEILEDRDRALRLDSLIEVRLDVTRAARQFGKRIGETVTMDAFARSINRLVERLGFLSVADMLVWYELDYKGEDNVRLWRKRLARLDWGVEAHQTHAALRYLAGVLEAERSDIPSRKSHVATQYGCGERTIDRTIKRFAEAEGLDTSLRWLVFVYCMVTQLKERKEPAPGESM